MWHQAMSLAPMRMHTRTVNVLDVFTSFCALLFVRQ